MAFDEPLSPVSLADDFFHRGFRLLVVGTGGTGGYVVQYLCRLLYGLQRPVSNLPITLTLMDGDTVEDGNLLRQHFLPQDVGRSKALVLAERFGTVYQFPVMAVPQYLTTPDGLDDLIASPRAGVSAYHSRPWDVVVGCVDNHATRQLLDQIFQRFADLIYIDAGNDAVAISDDPDTTQASGYGGHVVIGVKQGNTVRLPPVGTVYPDILTDTQSALPGHACGQQAVAQPQRMLTNVWAAMTVMSAINTLLTEQTVLWHVANFNARYGTARTHLLTPSYRAALPSAPSPRETISAAL